jgi:hypothetical protein
MGLIANISLRFANKETGLGHIGHIIALTGIEVACVCNQQERLVPKL